MWLIMAVQHVLFAYAFFLFSGGFTGFALGGFLPKAKTSLTVGVGSAAVAFVCALLCDINPPPKKGESGFVRWMVGVHLGLLLPLILGPVLLWRAYKAVGVPEKQYLAIILGALSAGSFVAFLLMYLMKPKKKVKA